ncbi:hypothetical protein B0J11DRAFT_509903 [Dendryphion nanum]|uniref:RelA/SpoT domain-containing protein n=1 Tax=Dendryphion nanum TaxID=256645 RepID=A0A9P9IEH6_9PLEO|nr:hypothetical protein B0J11DRAFT_509903 [Dendryphion nanum]
MTDNLLSHSTRLNPERDYNFNEQRQANEVIGHGEELGTQDQAVQKAKAFATALSTLKSAMDALDALGLPTVHSDQNMTVDTQDLLTKCNDVKEDLKDLSVRLDQHVHARLANAQNVSTLKQIPDNPIHAFLREYDEEETSWRSLTEYVGKQCEENLKTLGVPVRCSWRLKERDSLQKKVENKEKKREEGKYANLKAIKKEPWDIAGIRICLYFPKNMDKVEDFIFRHHAFKTNPQNPAQEIPGDISIATESNSIQTDVNPILIPQSYCKIFDERSYKPNDQNNRPYSERMGFYHARHYQVVIQDEKLLKIHKGWKGKQVEIQVRSVVMDAWAEVRHDLDYKKLLGKYPEEAELRVLDSIKGNISTGEILLDHLHSLIETRTNWNQSEFDFDNEQNFQKGIIRTLQVRHRQLLERYYKGKEFFLSSGLGALMQAMGYKTPQHLVAALEDIVDLEEAERLEHESIRFGFALYDIHCTHWDEKISFEVGHRTLSTMEAWIAQHYLGHEAPKDMAVNAVLISDLGNHLVLAKTISEQEVTREHLERAFSIVWHLKAYRWKRNPLLLVLSFLEHYRRAPEIGDVGKSMVHIMCTIVRSAIRFRNYGEDIECDSYCDTSTAWKICNKKSWHSGRYRASTIIGCSTDDLVSAALCRTITSSHATEDFIGFCLEAVGVDLNCVVQEPIPRDTIQNLTENIPILHLTIRKAPVGSISKLLTQPKLVIDVSGRYGLTALHYAVWAEKPSIVQELLNKGEIRDVINKVAMGNDLPRYLERISTNPSVSSIKNYIHFMSRAMFTTAFDLALLLGNQDMIDAIEKTCEQIKTTPLTCFPRGERKA